MGGSMRRGRLVTRLLAALLLTSLAAIAWPRGAHAAEYRVSACGKAANFHNNLLVGSVSDNRMSAFTACPNDSSGHLVGAAALAGIDRGTVPVFANAIQTFTAPAGTTIKHVHVNAEGRTWNGDWTSMLQASTDRFAHEAHKLSGCSGNPGSLNGCVSASPHLEQNYDTPGVTGIRAVVSCGYFGGCTTFSTDIWPFTRSYYFVRDFGVTLEDGTAPQFTSPSGALASRSWIHGTQRLTFDVRDESGISRTRFRVDDLGTPADDRHDCDYTFAVPCSNIAGGEYWLDTARLNDGVHYIAADAFDATEENAAELDETIYVDNNAPTEPRAALVVGGEGWRTTNDFTVRWANPPSAAPIDHASFDLCPAGGGGPCVSDDRTDRTGINRIDGIKVPGPGDWTVRVRLSDAAGNISEARSAPLHLKFDNVPPAQAAPQHRNGWIDNAHAHEVDEQIDPPVAGAPPVSGIAGYAVTSDGTTPGTTPSVVASAELGYTAHLHLAELAEGTTSVRARAISGAGVASPSVGSTELRVDRTAPTVALEGPPETDRWARSMVGLRIVARDPDSLSGMASGPDDRDDEAGGFIEYSLDGTEPQQVRGPKRSTDATGVLEYVERATADVNVDADGEHHLKFRAFDVAGNAARESSLAFKIDQTAPELAVFEEQQEADPRLVTVAASDRTSGLADGGKIELRRVSPTEGSWITLHTSRADDRYYAHIDNTTLPEGDYQFRATIPDQAGNEAVATHNRLDQEEVLHITPTQVGPYRTGDPVVDLPHDRGPDAQDARATVETRLTVGAVQRVVQKKPCKRKQKNSHKSCPSTQQRLVHELRLAFGRPATVRGRLTTSAGTPLPATEVTVLARPSAAGTGYRAVGSVRTDSTGAFIYRAPGGSSRTLDFLFRGDSTYKQADDQVILRVPAKATIRVSKRVVRNGRRVMFRGRLLGPPYPAKGKVLDLQAYYRHKWRTFGTPRAGRKGNWKYRYRFQATRGVVIYKFRIHVRATSDYPYEPTYSKAIKVRVVG